MLNHQKLSSQEASESEHDSVQLLTEDVPVAQEAAPDALTELLEQYREDAQHKRRRFWTVILLGTPILLLLIVLTLKAIPVKSLNLYEMLLLVSFGGGAGGILGYSGGRKMITRRQRQLVEKMLKTDDLRTVGVLLEALEYNGGIWLWGREIREASVRSLTHLLPRLTADAGELLTSEQRRCWYLALRFSKDADFIRASLTALAKVGDRAAEPVVEKFADPKSAYHAEGSACLAALRQRLEQVKKDAQLLRPSVAPDEPGSILLRPVHSAASHDDADRLLRPAAVEDEIS